MIQVMKMTMTTGTARKKTDSAKREIASQFKANQVEDFENPIYYFAVRSTIYKFPPSADRQIGRNLPLAPSFDVKKC